MRVAGILLLGLVGGLLLSAEEASAPCLPVSVRSCEACHAPDAGRRWEARRTRPCSQFCLTCHAPKDMDRHHPVGGKLPAPPHAAMLLTAEGTTGCPTCHDLGQPRFDRVRWKAESLYDRLFRRQPRYRTYFLAARNDRGQLCKACH